jgi:hypothetical protein
MSTELYPYTKDYLTTTSCRICHSDELTEVLNLGYHYVNDFPLPGDLNNRKVCPIVLDRCSRCSLVQQRCSVPPATLYQYHYWYRSGTTETMRNRLKDVAQDVMNKIHLQTGDVVLDVGANDGTLLSNYPPDLLRVGVEPATNLQEECRKHCDVVVPTFWSNAEYRAKMIEEGFIERKAGRNGISIQTVPLAKVITALGMFYDLEDPNPFIHDVAMALDRNGLFVFQMMGWNQTLRQGDVGNLCHEHLEFYTLHSLKVLLGKHGLRMVEIQENDVNGGSYRVYCKHAEDTDDCRGVDDLVNQDLRECSVGDVATFTKKIDTTRKTVLAFVRSAISSGKRVWVYGASTKGNTLLQYWGLDPYQIQGAVDKSEEKVGRCTVNGIPIYSEKDFRESNPEYALILPYTFAEEFAAREVEWRRGGGVFIVPLPEFRTIV